MDKKEESLVLGTDIETWLSQSKKGEYITSIGQTMTNQHLRKKYK